MSEKLAETLLGILLHMLLSRRRSLEEEETRRRRRHDERRQRFFSIAIPELRTAGARRVYCRYDGGGDEGWCWLESFEMQDSRRAGVTALTRPLLDAPLVGKLAAVNLLPFYPLLGWSVYFRDDRIVRRTGTRCDTQSQVWNRRKGIFVSGAVLRSIGRQRALA